MGTRCLIGKLDDFYEGREPYGVVTYIYCHYDGYPEYVGDCLSTHWRNPRKINALLDRGDIVSLGSKLKDKNKSNSKLNTQFSVDSSIHELETELNYGSAKWLKENWWDIEYLYLYKDGKWYCKGWDSDWFELE
jgi:hypothetical protein